MKKTIVELQDFVICCPTCNDTWNLLLKSYTGLPDDLEITYRYSGIRETNEEN